MSGRHLTRVLRERSARASEARRARISPVAAPRHAAPPRARPARARRGAARGRQRVRRFQPASDRGKFPDMQEGQHEEPVMGSNGSLLAELLAETGVAPTNGAYHDVKR